ncbi:MAG: serine/threonine protein kinase [Muribaculaceae bacterium]|nr:serine/threonine protein kinase [Muribaculaceae bacterium]
MFLKEYEKIRLIGKGAFSSVYKVRHAKYGYVRALKVCKDFIEDETDKAWDTFISECRVLLNIGNGSHPNIVHIYQPRLLDNRAIVEMDCVEGDSLHDFISTHKFVSLSEVLAFAEQVVDAVAYCHVDVYKFLMDPKTDDLQPDPSDGRKYVITSEKEAQLIAKYGVVHNDLHSNNIIRRDYDGKYILLDFGLAIQDSHCVKSSSRFDGAIEYSSPEKLERGEVSAQSDVYALGILMYEMLCGHVPFRYITTDGTSPESARNRVYQQHLHNLPPDICSERRKAFAAVNPGEEFKIDYPPQLERIILKCLAKRPEERYKNARELLGELKSIIKHDVEFAEDIAAIQKQKNELEYRTNIMQQKIDTQQQTINNQQQIIAKLQQELNTLKGSNISERFPVDEDDDIPIVEIEYEDTPAEDTPQQKNGWTSIFKKKSH